MTASRAEDWFKSPPPQESTDAMVGEAMSRRFAAQRLAGYGRAGWGRRFAPSEAVEQRCRTTRLATFDAARGPWEQHAAEQDNFFITYEFARAWWQVYGRGGELFLHQVFDERGQSIGILPLYVSTIRFGRFARFIGHGPADQLGPVCGAESRPAVAAALRDLIDGAGQPSTLLAERMRADEGWQEMLHGRHIRRESFSLIDLRELDWEGWLETKSANFRQQTRKAERRLARDHRLEYRLVTDEAEVLPALETLIRLHDARWRGASAAFDPKRRAFHERFAMAAARRGWLRVLLATIDGEPAAAWLGYRYGGAESSYLMGWAPEWAPHNVGSVLRMHAIREATGHVDEFRLLLGNEPHKQRLATADPGLDTFLVGDAMLPRVAHALIEQRHRTPAVMRRLVASRLGW